MAARTRKVKLNEAPPDARAIRLRQIDEEVARLKDLRVQKQKQFDRNTGRHLSQWDHDENDRLQRQIGDLDQKIQKLAEQRYRVELGEDEKSVAAAPSSAPAKARREWPIRDLPEPSYPTGARASGNTDLLEERLAAFIDFQANETMKGLKAAGVKPDVTVNYEVLAYIVGQVRGYAEWVGARFGELQDRLHAIEAGVIKWAGSYQRAVAYQRGSIVNHKGSSWVAIRDTGEGEQPGESTPWQLMVKRGRDANEVR